MNRRLLVKFFDIALSVVGVALACFRAFGFVFFFTNNAWWLLVPAVVLLFLSVCSLKFLGRHRWSLVVLAGAYVVSYAAGGLQRILVESLIFPDVIEAPIIFYLLLRASKQPDADSE